MIRRRPDLLALIFALIGTLAVVAVFISDLVLSRERELEQGERRVQHFGVMVGEHTARTFEAVDIQLREIASGKVGTEVLKRNATPPAAPGPLGI